MQLTLTRKALILIFVPLVFELVFVSVLLYFLGQSETEARAEEMRRRAIATGGRLLLVPEQMQDVLTTYAKTKEPERLKDYAKLSEEMKSDIDALRPLVEGDPAQAQVIWRVENRAKQLSRTYDNMIAEWAGSDKEKLDAALKDMKHTFEPAIVSIRKDIRDFLDGEQKLEALAPSSAGKLRAQFKQIIAGGVVFNIIVALGLALWFSKVSVRGLRTLMDNSRKLSEGAPLNPQIKGGDEIAALDKVFHRMAEALAEASRKERAVFEKAVDVICSLDADGKFTRVNPASHKVWGYQPEELLRRDVVEFLHPDDVRTTIDVQLAIQKEGSGAPYENRFRCKDGNYLDMLWTTHWSQIDNALYCVAHDITDRKRAEEAIRSSEARIRFIIANMPVGLVLLSPQGEIELVNSAMDDMFKFEPGELVGKPFGMLFQRKADQSEVEVWETLRERAIGHIHERMAEQKDGNTFPSHLTIREYDSKDGLKYMGIMLDVSERHEIERFKQEFLGVISHELRTPLTSIRGSFEMLLAGMFGELTKEAKHVINIAEKSSTRLIRLVNDLLDMEKLESGKLDMFMEDTDANAIVETSVENVRYFAEDHGVEIVVPSVDLPLIADGERLVQVVVNLLSNAIKFSERGHKVTVEVVSTETFAEFRISDTGRGIPAEHIGKLFNRFTQVEKADATKKKGSGLGLAICKAIIEEHHGQIGVDSELGKGSTFWFRIPLRPQQGEKQPYVVGKKSD
ncbi:MAG: PAS domain S-box protein [Candidatus Obscuribacterales bacterium]|nr:PAS domain S-box protein [Candidatus Obscuribacterales bacterium]